ncbi:GntR family transcriptional regulator [Streptomyces sp. NRRL F-5126]|uniref:GntR family transcriptional regulator n=1 Tax=Streptomyces sp. NRRL F-5126 TaxID=1463857 RepID=UPI0018FE4945|nr:GntR family transcriptional regulator [Streptomyces sp. NRRL F-5126]
MSTAPSRPPYPKIGDKAGWHELTRMLGRGVPGASIADEIAVAVAAEIIEGRLSPGDDLNSVELARTFNSSRTPVREALLVLEREGFVQITARRRPRVARLLLSEVRELYNLRAELYAVVSHLVCKVATADDLDALRRHQHALDLAAAEDDVDRYFWVNVQYRNKEAAIARDATLRRVLDTLGLRALQLRHLSLSQPGRLGPSAKDHARLLRAYEERDADLASALTQSLVRGGFAAIERSGWTGEEP